MRAALAVSISLVVVFGWTQAAGAQEPPNLPAPALDRNVLVENGIGTLHWTSVAGITLVDGQPVEADVTYEVQQRVIGTNVGWQTLPHGGYPVTIDSSGSPVSATVGSHEHPVGEGYRWRVRAQASGFADSDWSATGIANDITPQRQLEDDHMYWTELVSHDIKRANLDGSSIETLISSGLSRPRGIALDVSGGKMYWAESGNDDIKRANLDGSSIETLISTGLDNPNGIALDVSGGKMYWTEFGNDDIKRANLDGSSIDTLISTGLDDPRGIALDVSGGKMYWAESGNDDIKRANLDGSSIETLISTGLDNPRGIALDVSGGKMYWAESGSADDIKRANLDGSSIETLISTGLDEPYGIALDVSGGKMYWAELGSANDIKRASLTGGTIEGLITSGLSGPTSIALLIKAPEADPTTIPGGIVAARSYRPALDASGQRSLVIVHYNIADDDDDLTAHSIDEEYVLQVKAVGGTDDGDVLVLAQPYPYNRLGYGHGLVGLLTPATDADSLIVSLISIDGAISSIDGQTHAADARPRAQLETDVRELVRYIDARWGDTVSLLDASGGLTPSGAAYIGAAIPYAEDVLPSLYTHTVRPVEIERRDGGEAYAEDLLDQGGEGDTAWNTQFDAMASWTGQSATMITTLITLALAVACAVFFSKLAGSGLVTLPIITIALLGGAMIGWVYIQLVALMGFVGLVVLAWILVLKRVN